MDPISTMDTPQKRDNAWREKALFDELLYNRYLQTNADASSLASKCNLWIMANLVRDWLPHNSEAAYDTIDNLNERKRKVIETGISYHQAQAEYARCIGQVDLASQLDAEVSCGKETLAKIDDESRPKILGAVRTQALPGGLLFLVFLEEYIAARVGSYPPAKQLAHIISGLAVGFDELPDGVDPELLTKRVEKWRERNPGYIEEMRRLIAIDDSGQSQLDRQYGNGLVTPESKFRSSLL